MNLSEKRIAAAAAARNCARVFEELATSLEDPTQKISDLCEATAHAELALTDRVLEVIDSEEHTNLRGGLAALRLVTPP